MRIYHRKTVRPEADFQTVKMSIEIMHLLLNSGQGFMSGNGSSHVTRCSCDSCKFVKQANKNGLQYAYNSQTKGSI